MKKQVLSLVVSAAMMASMMPKPVFATNKAITFPDMPNDWSTQALQNAINNGLLNGIDGKIAAGENLTRAQMAAIVTRAFGTNGKADISSFGDVNVGDWFYDAMASSVLMGAIQGDGVNLNPNADITRQEAFTILARLFTLSGGDQSVLGSYTDGDQVADWAKDSMASMVAAGYVQGFDNKLSPQSSITRAEFAQVMDNLVKTYFADSQLNVNADGNAVLNKAGTLEGATISGDLIIGDGVAEGDVVLKDVTVSGRLLVRGGGTSTVTLEGNTTVGDITVNKPTGTVRVENTTDKAVDVSVVSDNVVLTGAFDQVNANASQGTITLNGAEVAAMNVAGNGVKVVVENGSTITTMSVTGSDATVQAEEGAKIDKITTSAANTTVSGKGSVANFEAAQGSSGASITTDGTKVTNNGTGDVTTGGDKVIPSGSTGTSQSGNSTPGGGGSNGGGGGVTVPTLPASIASQTFPEGLESTPEGLSRDENAELPEEGELTQEKVSSMGQGGQYVTYFTVPKAQLEEFDQIAYSVNGGNELTWDIENDSEKAGWYTDDGTNVYFKLGNSFAEKINGIWQMKAETFHHSIKFYNDSNLVATLQFTVDMSGYTIASVTEISGLEGVKHSQTEYPEISPTSGTLDRDESAELPEEGELTQEKVASMGQGGQYVTYYTIPKTVVEKFDTITYGVNDGAEQRWEVSTSDTGWCAEDDGNVYFKLGHAFASKNQGVWEMKDNGQFDHYVNFWNDGSVVAALNFTVDMSGYTISKELEITSVEKATSSGNFDNTSNINEMMTALWEQQEGDVQGITVNPVFRYEDGTLTVTKANITEDLLQWITTQWGGTSVPVKLTLSQEYTGAQDANWDGATLAWIDLSTVATGEMTVDLGNGYTAALNINVAE